MVYFVKVLGQVEEVVSPFNIWILGIQLRLLNVIVGTFAG